MQYIFIIIIYKSNMFKFEGTGVAIVTPFKEGAVDYAGLERLVEHCIGGGVEFLVVLGTTGESPVLSASEKFSVLDAVARINGGRIGLVAGFGGNNTRGVAELIEQYSFEGYDGILSVSPAYNKPTQEGIYRHFMSLAEVAPRPIILYNVPGRTAGNMEAATTLRLAHSGGTAFAAIKEASGNMRQCMEILHGKPAHFELLSGDDHFTLPLIALGARGVISVVANALPSPFSDMTRAALAGNWDKARELHYALLHLIDGLFAEGNPAGVKACLQLLGICSDELRLPLVPVSDELRNRLRQQLNVQ